jgi:rare lipoprotein A
MREHIAHGLATVLFVVSLGAAQGPTSSGSKDTQKQAIKKQVGSEPGSEAQSKKRRSPYQVGTASWYGEQFDGRETASGETYDMYDLTAAHPTLPLGSWVRVTNLHNGRVINVRINDRGPLIPGSIIDLSYGAAEALRFHDRGLQRVRLDVVQPKELAMLEPMAN